MIFRMLGKIAIIIKNFTLMLRGGLSQDTPPFVNVQFKNVLPIIEDGYLFRICNHEN